MDRKEAVETAEKIVCGERDKQYGPPENVFLDIATLWETYLTIAKGPTTGYVSLSTKDVAVMMILLKIARLGGTAKADNWVDIIGYAACGCELETEH